MVFHSYSRYLQVAKEREVKSLAQIGGKGGHWKASWKGALFRLGH